MKCKNCGNEVKENAKFCRECGSKIIWETEALTTNVCPACGNILEENAVFCNNCGCSISVSTESIDDNAEKCSRCGNKINPGALFCGECGNPINHESKKNTTYSNESKKQIKKKKDKGMVFLVFLLIVVIICSAVVIGYVYYQNNSVEITTPILDDSSDIKEDDETNNDDYDENSYEMENPETRSSDKPVEEQEEEVIYLFPSDSEYITEADLYGKSKDEVALIRNEIYARHGYIFNTEPFKTYFSKKEWYIPNPSFNESLFNEIEKINKDFLVEYEKSRGWR